MVCARNHKLTCSNTIEKQSYWEEVRLLITIYNILLFTCYNFRWEITMATKRNRWWECVSNGLRKNVLISLNAWFHFTSSDGGKILFKYKQHFRFKLFVICMTALLYWQMKITYIKLLLRTKAHCPGQHVLWVCN